MKSGIYILALLVCIIAVAFSVTSCNKSQHIDPVEMDFQDSLLYQLEYEDL